MPQVYSFDVFNTCIIRYYVQPDDFFLTWARNVLSCQTTDINTTTPTVEQVQDLARLRIQAETSARKKAHPKEDILLVEIYENLNCPTWCHTPKETMMNLEIQLEKKCLYPIESTRQRIKMLREKGNKIIFVSEMYFPSSIIQQILIQHGYATPEDHIYVSGEVGLSKRTGRLYHYVLQAEQIKAKELYHYGDDTLADYVIPKRCGILAEQYFESRLLGYESLIHESAPSGQPWASMLAGVSRVARLMQPKPFHPSWPGLVAQVIAPLLTAFVVWVLREAKKEGIERLYFVSRDGQILQKIAQRIAHKCNEPMPECHYLYGSRQSLFFPGIEKIDRQNLDWFIVSGHSKSPRHLLKKIHLCPEEIRDILIAHGFPPETWDQQMPKEVEKFWQVLEQAEVKNLLTQRIASARELTLDYFAQEGIGDPQHPWSLVDSGWSLKSQRAIWNILKHTKNPSPPMGYYLGLTNSRVMLDQCGRFRALLESSHTRTGHSWGEIIFRYVRIVEQVFTISDHGSVTGYARQPDGHIQALCKDYHPSDEHKKFLECFTKTILDYTDLVVDSGIFPEYIDDLKITALTTMKTFFTQPNPDYVKALLWVKFGDDQNESRMYSLSKRLWLWDIVILGKYFFDYLRHGASADFPQQYSWWESCVAISPSWIAGLFRWAFQWRRKFLNSPMFLNWQFRHIGKR